MGINVYYLLILVILLLIYINKVLRIIKKFIMKFKFYYKTLNIIIILLKDKNIRQNERTIIIGNDDILDYDYILINYISNQILDLYINIYDIEDGYEFRDYYKENINENDNLNIIIKSNGGSIYSSDIFYSVLITHKGNINVYIPDYAYSSGSYIALLGTKLYLGKNALMSPTDPIYIFPENYTTEKYIASKNIIDLENKIKLDEKNVELLLIISENKKLFNENKYNVERALKKNNYDNKSIKQIIKTFCSGIYKHSSKIDKGKLKSIGLLYSDDIPQHILNLFNYFLI